MDRWKEHFQDLLNRPSSTDPNALNNKDKLPCNADMDIPPSLEEIEDAIKSLKNGKAPGADGIPSEVYKYMVGSVLFKLCTLSSRPAGMKLNYPKTSKLRLSLSSWKETALSVVTIVESHCYQLLAKFLPRSYCPDYKKLQVRYFLKANVVSEPTDLQLMQSSHSVSYREINRTAKTPVYGLHWFYQSIWHRQSWITVETSGPLWMS